MLGQGSAAAECAGVAKAFDIVAICITPQDKSGCRLIPVAPAEIAGSSGN
jgi:hypothetical protein